MRFVRLLSNFPNIHFKLKSLTKQWYANMPCLMHTYTYTFGFFNFSGEQIAILGMRRRIEIDEIFNDNGDRKHGMGSLVSVNARWSEVTVVKLACAEIPFFSSFFCFYYSLTIYWVKRKCKRRIDKRKKDKKRKGNYLNRNNGKWHVFVYRFGYLYMNRFGYLCMNRFG